MNRRPARASRSFLPVAFGVCVLLGSVAGQHGLPGLLKARAQSRQLAAQVAALRTKNAALRARVDELRNDPSEIERVARRDLGLARRDELVVVLTGTPGPSKP
jgi:cell division protein FtsB